MIQNLESADGWLNDVQQNLRSIQLDVGINFIGYATCNKTELGACEVAPVTK